MADYQVYGGAPSAPEREDGPWQVLTEFSNGGDRKPPTVVRIDPRTFRDRSEALAAAEKVAHDFSPPDPWSLQSRTVYRDGRDGFLVVLQGATSTFHMSVRLVVPMS